MHVRYLWRMTREDLLRPLGTLGADAQTSLRLPTVLLSRLAAYAASVGMSRSQLVVRILLAGLDDLERQ